MCSFRNSHISMDILFSLRLVYFLFQKQIDLLSTISFQWIFIVLNSFTQIKQNKRCFQLYGIYFSTLDTNCCPYVWFRFHCSFYLFPLTGEGPIWHLGEWFTNYPCKHNNHLLGMLFQYHNILDEGMEAVCFKLHISVT